MFQELEAHLQSEINTLGYPQAALFGFCVALIAYNVMAVVKAALRQVHGEEKSETMCLAITLREKSAEHMKA